jgi:hypothetical protein
MKKRTCLCSGCKTIQVVGTRCGLCSYPCVGSSLAGKEDVMPRANSKAVMFLDEGDLVHLGDVRGEVDRIASNGDVSIDELISGEICFEADLDYLMMDLDNLGK